MSQNVNPIEAQETAQQTPAGNAEAQTTAVVNTTPTDLGTNDQASASADCATKAKTPKAKPAPDYGLHYTPEMLAELTSIKEVVLDEINRVSNDPLYGAIPYAGGNNAVVDINLAYRNGIHLAAADVNREHGSDEEKTGASIMKYGMQHPIIFITIKMAKAAGIEVKHFLNDPDQTYEFKDNDLVLLDGHGRIDYLISIDPKDWPLVFGVFPSPDRDGFYDIPKLMTEINVNVSKWSTQDLVQKRRLEEGSKAHPGWEFVADLVKQGYMYQAACLAGTLGNDRIKASEVNSGDAEQIFANFTHAIKIHEALVKKVDETVLKTKHFPMEISVLWAKLVAKSGNDFATENMLKFIENLPAATVSAINTAKKTKEGVSKDEVRKQLLKDAFSVYCSLNNIQF